MTTSRFNFTACIFIITALNTALYFNTLAAPFVYDDLYTIVETEGQDALGRNIRDINSHFHNFFNSGLRPLTNISLALNYHIGNLCTFGYHLFNIIFHIFTAIILMLVVSHTLRILNTGFSSISFICAVFFSILPIHAETVTYIISRSTLLSSFFLATALYFFITASTVTSLNFSKSKILFFLSSLLFFSAGVLSKETALVFLLIVIAYDYSIISTNKAFSFKYRFILFYSILFFFLAYFVLHYYKTITDLVAHQIQIRNISDNLISQINLIPFIAKTLVLPINLSVDYDFSTVNSFLAFRLTLTLAILAALIIYITWNDFNRVIPFSLTWIIITLLPTNSILPRRTLMSDHNLYLSSLGICLILSFFIYKFFALKNRVFPRYFLGCCVLIFCFLSSLTVQRNNVYRSTDRLWGDAAKKSPNMARPRVNFGNALLKDNKLEEAIAQYTLALKIDPGLSSAYNNLGIIFNKMGKTDAAIASFSKAVQIDSQDEVAYKNLGIIYGQNRLYQEAEKAFQRAITIYPNYAEAYHDLGRLQFDMGRIEESIESYKHALQINPNLAIAYSSMGQAMIKIEKYEDAIKYFFKVLLLDPNNADALNDIGIIYAEKGNLNEAISQFQKTLAFHPNNEKAHFNLGITFLRKDNLTAAGVHFSKVLQLNPDNADAHIHLGNILFEQGNLDAAEDHFSQARRLKPERKEIVPQPRNN